MAQKYLFISISFYRNIARQNVSCEWGTFYLFIANFFATQVIGGAKELVVLLCLSGDI